MITLPHNVDHGGLDSILLVDLLADSMALLIS